ncbi:MAG: helix-turn-helix domain-containing protein, partial [Kiritimatiellae bacterium]|nr:helix-turn-helix domain-containing protein [Kiritimatiellia bacterium]
CLLAAHPARAQKESGGSKKKPTEPPVFLIRSTDRPISVNGILTEWAGSERLNLAAKRRVNGIRHAAVVMAAWDWEKLYVAIDVRDTQLNALEVENDREAWRDDCVEFYWGLNTNAPDRNLSENEYHVVASVNGTIGTYRGSRRTANGEYQQDPSWNPDVLVGVQLNGTLNDNTDVDEGYTIELAVNWADMGHVPRPWEYLIADIGISDRNAPDVLDGQVQSYDWCGVRPYAQPSQWGLVRIGGRPAGPRPAWHAEATDKARIPLAAIAVGGAVLMLAAALAAGLLMRRRRKRPTGEAAQPAEAGDRVCLESAPGGPPPAEPAAPADRGERIVERVVAIIREEYGTELSTGDVAQRLSLSERQLQRVVQRETGKRFRELLNEQRLTRARELLKETELTITQICFKVGYGEHAYFSRLFKKQFGLSPSDYRNKARAGADTTADASPAPLTEAS